MGVNIFSLEICVGLKAAIIPIINYTLTYCIYGHAHWHHLDVSFLRIHKKKTVRQWPGFVRSSAQRGAVATSLIWGHRLHDVKTVMEDDSGSNYTKLPETAACWYPRIMMRTLTIRTHRSILRNWNIGLCLVFFFLWGGKRLMWAQPFYIYLQTNTYVQDEIVPHITLCEKVTLPVQYNTYRINRAPYSHWQVSMKLI